MTLDFIHYLDELNTSNKKNDDFIKLCKISLFDHITGIEINNKHHIHIEIIK